MNGITSSALTRRSTPLLPSWAMRCEGTSPVVGEPGPEERVPDLRLETIYPVDRHDDVFAALRRAHPYEEPAFDVYELVG